MTSQSSAVSKSPVATDVTVALIALVIGAVFSSYLPFVAAAGYVAFKAMVRSRAVSDNSPVV